MVSIKDIFYLVSIENGMSGGIKQNCYKMDN